MKNKSPEVNDGTIEYQEIFNISLHCDAQALRILSDAKLKKYLVLIGLSKDIFDRKVVDNRHAKLENQATSWVIQNAIDMLNDELKWRNDAVGSVDPMIEYLNWQNQMASNAADLHYFSDFENSISGLEDKAAIWNVLNALVEVGVPLNQLSFGSVQPIYCQILEPNGTLSTEFNEQLLAVVNFIGMPHLVVNDFEIYLKSDAVGVAGFNRGTLPTADTLDNAHLALLFSSDAYWNVLPARFKTPDYVEHELPKLFDVDSVFKIPSPWLQAMAIQVLTEARKELVRSRIDECMSKMPLGAIPGPRRRMGDL